MTQIRPTKFPTNPLWLFSESCTGFSSTQFHQTNFPCTLMNDTLTSFNTTVYWNAFKRLEKNVHNIQTHAPTPLILQKKRKFPHSPVLYQEEKNVRNIQTHALTPLILQKKKKVHTLTGTLPGRKECSQHPNTHAPTRYSTKRNEKKVHRRNQTPHASHHTRTNTVLPSGALGCT